MSRFEDAWRRWDRALGREPRSSVLSRLANDEILALLAGGDVNRRRYEMDVLATELMNRLQRLKDSLAVTRQEVEAILQAADVTAEVAVGATEASEAAILQHLEAQRDQVTNEPEAAHVATEAARQLRQQLKRAVEAHEPLREMDRRAARRNSSASPLGQDEEPTGD